MRKEMDTAAVIKEIDRLKDEVERYYEVIYTHNLDDYTREDYIRMINRNEKKANKLEEMLLNPSMRRFR